MLVNIKGTKYKVTKQSKPFIEDGIDSTLDGVCDYRNKHIKINITNYEKYDKQVIAHELIHGFFRECGLGCFSENETLVDWIACNIQEITTKTNELYEKLKNKEE